MLDRDLNREACGWNWLGIRVYCGNAELHNWFLPHTSEKCDFFVCAKTVQVGALEPQLCNIKDPRAPQ